MLTGEVKQRLIAVLSELVARHQRARAQVTDEVQFMDLIVSHNCTLTNYRFCARTSTASVA
jgi:hypothetical protein